MKKQAFSHNDGGSMAVWKYILVICGSYALQGQHEQLFRKYAPIAPKRNTDLGFCKSLVTTFSINK